MKHKEPRYTYQFNGRDGTFDLIQIINPNGQAVAALFYWDEPDTDEAARVEESARLICLHLNDWYLGSDDVSPDGWVDIQFAALRYRLATALHAAKRLIVEKLRPSLINIRSALTSRREVALIWRTYQVQFIRPDLDEDQAWQVLQSINDDFTIESKCEFVLRQHAEKLFGSVSPQQADDARG